MGKLTIAFGESRPRADTNGLKLEKKTKRETISFRQLPEIVNPSFFENPNLCPKIRDE